MYPKYFTDKVISHVIGKNIAPKDKPANSEDSTDHNLESFYFKLPYIGNFSSLTQKRIKLQIKYVAFSVRKTLFLVSFALVYIVYKFSCAGCNASYVGETTRHLARRVHEHLSRNKASHINKHLVKNEGCRAVCSKNSFQILKSAPTNFQLKIKEVIYIQWENPSLNSQVKHLNLCLSIWFFFVILL